MKTEDFLKEIIDETAYQKASRGEGTGAASRILSHFNILLLVALLAVLLKEQSYLVAILLLGSFFTRFSLFVGVGAFIYFVLNTHLIAATLLAIYTVTGWLSVALGIRNAKTLFLSNKTAVDPLEGMPDLALFLPFQIIFLVVALLTPRAFSITAWIFFGIITIFLIYRYCFRLVSPWRKLHYPLMIRYASIAGYESSLAEKEGRTFDMNAALILFIKNIYPLLQPDAITQFLDTIDRKMSDFNERNQLATSLKSKSSSIDTQALDELLELFHKMLKQRNPRWVIAEIIDRDYGTKEKVKYLQAVLLKQAD